MAGLRDEEPDRGELAAGRLNDALTAAIGRGSLGGMAGDRAEDEDEAGAADALRRGALVGLPTETVYGLAADASAPEAVERLFEAKGRPEGRPLPVALPEAEAAGAWAAAWPEPARRLAERFWPGPLTLVLRARADVPGRLTAGGDRIGLRVPDHPRTLAVLRAVGGGVALPSANRHGRPSATSAEEVRQELGEAIELCLDGGPCRLGLESTVVRVDEDELALLRSGALPVEALEAAAGRRIARDEAGAATTTRFDPTTPLELRDRDGLGERAARCVRAGEFPVVVARDPLPALPNGVRVLPLPPREAELARAFYRALREADEAGADRILVEEPPDTALGHALRERLGGGAQ